MVEMSSCRTSRRTGHHNETEMKLKELLTVDLASSLSLECSSGCRHVEPVDGLPPRPRHASQRVEGEFSRPQSRRLVVWREDADETLRYHLVDHRLGQQVVMLAHTDRHTENQNVGGVGSDWW